MRVLWFANTPCEAAEYLTGRGVRSGGWLYALCNRLKEEDIELHIAFFWGKNLGAFSYKGVSYHPIWREGDDTMLGRYVNRLRGQFSATDDVKDIQKCRQIICIVQPDIIHIHGSEESFGLIAQDDTIGVPIVLSIQGLLSAYRMKYYSGISCNALNSCEPLLKRILLDGTNGRFRNFSRRAEREICIFKSLRYVIGRTNWDKRCAQALNPKIKYYTVNEILRSKFVEVKWQKRAETTPFKIVSTISSGTYKGLEVVYQTANLLAGVGFAFEWQVIGIAHNDEIVNIVEKLYSVAASSISVMLLGGLSADEMVSVMMQSDLYVQVSHIENSPNSLCEAMVMGMPIIASMAGGTSSILQDGKEGIVIQDGNPYELAGAVMETMCKYDDAVRMGENARERALARHNPDNVIRELMAVYNDFSFTK